MASEVKIAREGGVMRLRSRNAVSGRTDRAHGRATLPAQNGRAAKIPKGKKLNYDDDIVSIYDDKGKKVSEGMWDYSPYNNDETYDSMKWDDKAGNYTIARGYRLVVKK